MLWEQVSFSPQNQKSSIECERTRKHVMARHADQPAAVETSPRVLRMLDRLFSCTDIPQKMTNSTFNEELKRTDGAGEDVMGEAGVRSFRFHAYCYHVSGRVWASLQYSASLYLI